MLIICSSRLCDNGSVVAVDCLGETPKTQEDGKPHKITFYLLPEEYAPLHLQPGDADEALEAELKRLDEHCRALRQARRLLGYSSNTAAGLETKLRSRGYSREAALFAAQTVLGDGEVDETKDAIRSAELCVRKGRGRLRVAPELKQKGFGEEAIRAAMDSLSEVDFGEVCAEVIRKKWKVFPTDPAERKKAVAALARLGFTGNDIREAVKK